MPFDIDAETCDRALFPRRADSDSSAAAWGDLLPGSRRSGTPIVLVTRHGCAEFLVM